MENLTDFYKNKGLATERFQPLGIGHFNVFDIAQSLNPDAKPVKYTRRDFYKIALIRGKHFFHYANRSIETGGSTLLFFNPQVPYSFEQGDDHCTGKFLIFKEQFLQNSIHENPSHIPVFRMDGHPNFRLTQAQDAHITGIFEQILDELNSTYPYKYEVIRNRVTDIIHMALKLKPDTISTSKIDANTRLTFVFKEALERQFPVESPHYCINLKTPNDFADKLSVHVNSLNRALKKVTGKTTNQLIAERIISEATILLRLTDWSVSEIAYSLGFDVPTHFTTFFKRHTSTAPSALRKAV